MNLFNQQYTGRMDWGGQGAQVSQGSQNDQASQGDQTEGRMFGWPMEEKPDMDCGTPPAMILPMDNMLQQMRTDMPQQMRTPMPQPMRSEMSQPMRPGMPQPMCSGAQQPMWSDMPQPVQSDMSQPMRPDMQKPMRPGMQPSMPWSAKTDRQPSMQTDMPQINFGEMMENGMFPLGMSYVPIQEWSQPSPLEEGFNRGTMFSVLDLPFMMGRCR